MSVTRTPKETNIANVVNPALEHLDVLVGEWEVEASFPTDPPGTVILHASFKWLEDGAHLVCHIGDKNAGPPYGICVIGRDQSVETYTMLFFDDRRVSRVYQMSLEGSKWKQWRDAPGFSQRFVGQFSDDSDTIIAHWEKSTDGSHWEIDFDMTYRRVANVTSSI